MHRKQSRAHSAQEEEHVLEVNGASDDELEAEYQEAAAMMTVAKQRRTEVDRARQFFRKPQSSEERKGQTRQAQARCRPLGHWKGDNECPAKVRVVNWEETEGQVALEPPSFSDRNFFVTRERTVCNTKAV